MENAVNGLMIAGSILIGIIVISLFVYMFSNMGQISKDFQENIDASNIQKFNKDFEKYITKDISIEKKVRAVDLLTAHDLLTVYNLAQEKNKEAEEIVITIKYPGSLNLSDMTSFPTKDEKLYYCVSKSLKYDGETGKISYMEFKEAPKNSYEK